MTLRKDSELLSLCWVGSTVVSVRSYYAVSFARPLRRRAATMARPARVRMRIRKPCFFERRRLFGWNVRLPFATVNTPQAIETGAHHIGQPRRSTACGRGTQSWMMYAYGSSCSKSWLLMCIKSRCNQSSVRTSCRGHPQQSVMAKTRHRPKDKHSRVRICNHLVVCNNRLQQTTRVFVGVQNRHAAKKFLVTPQVETTKM